MTDDDCHLTGAQPPKSPPGRVWWGRYEIPECQLGRWRIGPLALWLFHRPQEWRVAHLAGLESEDTVEIEAPIPEAEVTPGAQVLRFVTENPGDEISLEPLLADRPVVVRPENRLLLLPGDEVAIYVSTPVWVRIRSGKANGRPLIEVPSQLQSDTWFGPSTFEGELGYSSLTQARLELANLPKRPNRAITEIRLANRAHDTLAVERINLPAPSLGLFVDADHHLWTESIVFERKGDGGLAEVRLHSRPAEEAGDATRLAPPRQVMSSRSGLVRRLNALLH